MSADIHVVLVAPKIPANTGNIIRLCANTGAKLHLVAPIAFDLDDKKLRRAGLDYHEYANLVVHDDWVCAKRALYAQGVEIVVALTTKFSQPFYDYDFGMDGGTCRTVALVFGSETDGLADDIRQDIGADNWLRLPMLLNSRSLNLSNSVAICLYEVWRQQGFAGDIGYSAGYDRPNSK